MASLYCFIAAGFFLQCCLTTSFAEESRRSEQENNQTFIKCNTNVKALYETTNLTACKLIVNDSKISEVISKHDNANTTNIVKITVSIVGKKTRFCQKLELDWASEVGRTILTLVRRAKDIRLFRSPLFILPLEVGTEKVDIQLKEKADGCLPPGERVSEHIFDFILRRLSHRDDTHVFKLCKPYDDETTRYTTFNCCRIVGDRNSAICADYWSVVVDWALPVVVFIFVISCLMVIPFILQHIVTCPENKFHKMSDSPMSLPSIASVILFGGRGPFKSLFRRCVFVGLSYLVVFFPDFFGFEWLKWTFILWATLFLVFDDSHMTYEEGSEKPRLDVNFIFCFKAPLCDPIYWALTEFPNKFEKGGTWIKSKIENNGNIIKALYELLYKFFNVFQAFCIGFFVLTILICYPIVVVCFLLRFLIFDLVAFFIRPNHGVKAVICGILVRFPIFVISIFLTGMAFISVLSLVASLTLNAELLNPFIAPILSVVAYFWKNWKWSVEAKCVQLKTLIIEVSREKVPAKDQENQDETNRNANTKDRTSHKWKRELDRLRLLCPCLLDTNKKKSKEEGQQMEERPSRQPSNNDSDKPTMCRCKSGKESYDQVPTTEPIPDTPAEREGGLCDQKNIIKFDEHGEALISKELYELFSDKVLRLDQLLFYFFRRVAFVGLYAFCMLTVMILARDSGVSGIVQFINAILGVLTPLVFDTIFAEQHLVQRISEETAMRQKLEHILKVKGHENNTIIVVELRDTSSGNKPSTSGSSNIIYQWVSSV